MTDRINDGVTFMQFVLEDSPGHFMLARCEDDFVTHLLAPNGLWIELPSEEDASDAIFRDMVLSGDMPCWAVPEADDEEGENVPVPVP